MLTIDSDVYAQLNAWYQKPLGKALANTIAEQLQRHISDIFGYHLLQLGIPCQNHWLEASPIPNHICLVPEPEGLEANVASQYDALPFETGSIDLVLLPHTLGFVTNPKQVLQEVDRVLVPEGHVAIIGFNPISLWGMVRPFARYRGTVPWTGNFISSFQLRKQLKALGYKLQLHHSFFYRPPFKRQPWLDKFMFLETMGSLSWIYPGAAYLLLAQKQVIGMTPIKPIWTFRNFVIGKQTVQPGAANFERKKPL